ncbi:MAG: translocation/assembly module TamB domain-containing protein [Synechococcales cyanobacterium M58_A2018_015]|nr:translocation/assembly module TamB domain-containing protein [Synechococcales cyanobacterium M58_A2018_015]
MTHSPDPGRDPEQRSPSRRSVLIRAGFVAGGVVLVGGIAAGWFAWQFINQRLAPLVADSMSTLLNRPVVVGPVEGVSLSSIRFGNSSIPPTATDPDQLTVESVEARFNLLELIWDRTLSLDVTLIRPEAYIDQDAEGRWITTEITPGEEGPISIEVDTLRVQDGNLQLAAYGEVEESQVVETEADNAADPDRNGEDAPETLPRDQAMNTLVAIQDVNGTVTFRNQNQLIRYSLSGRPETGGSLQLQGQTNLEASETRLEVDGRDLLAADVNLLVPLPVQLRMGRVSADLAILFPPDEQPLQFDGIVQAQSVTAALEGAPLPFTEINGNLLFAGQQISFQDFQGRYGAILATVGGSLDTQDDYNLRVQVPEASVAQILETLDVAESELPVSVAGQFQGEVRITGAIEQPQVSGLVQNLQPVQVEQLELVRTQARFSVTPEALTLSRVEVVPRQGGQVVGRGRVTFGEQGGVVFDAEATDLPGDALARSFGANLDNFTIGQVNATAQVLGPLDTVQTIVNWQAPQATYPGRGRVTIAGDTIRFDDTAVLVAGGIARGSGQLRQGRWQADITTSGIELRQFSPDLRGLFSGDFRLAGSVDDFSLAGIRAEGNVRFSEGLAIITEPLTASVRWLGDRLQIVQASAPGFSSSGFIFAQLDGPGAPAVSNLDLAVDLRGYRLADLPVALPPQFTVAGTTDFNGQITGPLDRLTVAGQLGLNDFAVNTFAFEPRLAGDLRFVQNQGLSLNLTGQQDQIAVELDGQNRPRAFLVQQGNAVARGRGEGDRLIATLDNFPLAALNLAPATTVGLGLVSGQLSGNFDINLADLSNPDVVGNVAIVNPALDYISAELFAGQFRYRGGIFVLESGDLRRGNSRYLLSGSFSPTADPQLQGKVVVEQGRVEDVLLAFRWFEFADLGRGIQAPIYADAEAVETVPVGMPDAPLLTQLRRFSEVVALRDQQVAAREQATFLPDLAELEGGFTGEINLAYSPRTGAAVNFGLSGQDWRWGEYEVNQVIAQGSFQDGVLTLLPVRLVSDQAFLNFSGQLGGEEQSGQLLAENVPVEALRDLFRVPLDIAGNLNANAILSGSVENPQVVGEIRLENGTVNQTETIPPLRALFGYNNARLNFDTRLIAEAETDGEDTFEFTGSIPYQLPFATVEPASTELSLDLNIRNDGLALLNLFTEQVQWQGGTGDIVLTVRGNLQDTGDELELRPLTATGTATFANARIGGAALPEDVTNVNGTIRFNRDRIQVETLQGEFSSGQVIAQGTIPIVLPLSTTDPDSDAPLTIQLDNLALNLEDLYQGDVNGQVLVTGTALAPRIGGEILLSNGRVQLNQPEAEPVDVAAAPQPPTFGTPALGAPPEFDALRVSLGDRLHVTYDPVLNFQVQGNLLVNGTQAQPEVDGTVRLRRGQVNIFTTQFNLDRDYPNTAVFTSARGLDPLLDVRLVTSVPEVTRFPNPVSSPFPASEIVDTPSAGDFGALQTVRVQATVNGPASQLFNRLELTSSPSRSESEILALLGGGFVNNLTDGSAPTALASIAGSPLLTGLQNLISDTLGLSDFRLFPTTVISGERNTTLALAAEVGFDITNNLSVSVLQILTVDEPTQFSVRYRLTDRLLLRGSTNFDDSRAVLEFETRF